MVAGAQGSWSHRVCSQETDEHQSSASVGFSVSLGPRPVGWCRVCLSTSVNPQSILTITVNLIEKSRGQKKLVKMDIFLPLPVSRSSLQLKSVSTWGPARWLSRKSACCSNPVTWVSSLVYRMVEGDNELYKAVFRPLPKCHSMTLPYTATSCVCAHAHRYALIIFYLFKIIYFYFM